MFPAGETSFFGSRQMTPKEEHDITYSPKWAEVLNAIISARRNELQLKAIKQDR